MRKIFLGWGVIGMLVLGFTGCVEKKRQEEHASPRLSATVADELKDKLVKLDGKNLAPDPAALENKSVIAFYYSAHWCPPCRAFTPELVNFYNGAAKKYPNFQLIFVSNDKNAEAMKEYMEWGKMEFPALRYGENNPWVESLSAQGIPYLVVVDANGNQLAGKKADEDWRSPTETLEDLKKILQEKGGAIPGA